MRRNRLRVGILAATILAIVAHGLWWYFPGERPSRPTGDLSGPAADDDVWIWIAFPHLNLAELHSSVREGDELLAALARLGGLEAPGELPSFGPFPVPPAREMVLAMGEGGRRFRLEAQIDPALAGLARLAGIVAGNAWLSGGEIESPAGKVRVEWSGSRWVASRGDLPSRDSTRDFRLTEPALAAALLAGAELVPPEKVLVLRRSSTGLEVTSENPPSSWPTELRTEDEDMVLALLRGAGARGAGGLILFSGLETGGIRWGSETLSPPGAAVLHLRGTPRWELPGEGLFRVREVRVNDVEAVWQIASYSDSMAQRAAELIDPLLPRLAEAARGDLELALSMHPARAEAEVGSLLEILARFPLSSKTERQRWRDVHRALRALAQLERVTLVSGTSPPVFRLVLYPEQSAVD